MGNTVPLGEEEGGVQGLKSKASQGLRGTKRGRYKPFSELSPHQMGVRAKKLEETRCLAPGL